MKSIPAIIGAFGLFTIAAGACTIEETEPSRGTGSAAAGGTTTGVTGGGGETTTGMTSTGNGAGGVNNGPESSRESLARQQAENGWGDGNCPAGDSGTEVGNVLADLTLYDCENNPVNVSELCGADATWMFFAHGWCPHCRETGSLAEGIHDSFAGANLASINVVVEDSSGNPPTQATCAAWRDEYGHEDVITLFDPNGDSFVLWEENFTALNVILDDHVVATKIHTDVMGSITNAIQGAID